VPPVLKQRRPLPKPSPDSDPRFRKVMDDLKRGAARSKAHAPAARKAAEASAAAKGPPNEKSAGAKSNQVDKIQEAPAKKPETSSFLAMLRAEIKNAMPQTLGDTENFMKGGSSGQLKGSLKGNVSQKENEAAGDVKTASKETPKEGGVPTKESKPIPPEPATAAPAVNAGEGMPAPKSEADVSLQDSKQDADAQMKDAEVTPQQLQKANDPRFSAVLTAKDAVGKQADAGPAKYRAGEKGVLSQVAAQTTAQARTGGAAMVGVRGGANSAVLSKQALAKAKEEAERKKVTDHIESIYNRTKASVEQKLSALETEVGSIFDSGVDGALKAMTDYVEDRMYKWKFDRYLGSLWGAALWIKDKLKGLPPEANVIYEEGRTLFTGLMDKLVVRVAALVEQRLKEAKNEVAKGQAEIKSYVQGLSPNLRAAGQAAEKDVAGRFQELERGIDDKKSQLAQQLAQKYKEAFDKSNEALKKIQDENKGLIDAFLDGLLAVIKVLLEFKDKLMSLLKKGADTIKLILADPIGFLGNLIAAIKLGFQQFMANICKHLEKGFFRWLFGALAEAGIEIPDGLPSLPSILKLVLSVLGITYERMRAKAVKLIGEHAVTVIEKLVQYVKALIEGGPAKLWEQVKSDLSDLKQMALDTIQSYIVTTVVQRAIAKLVLLFNPVGAIVQAVLAIYDVVTFLIENAGKIVALLEAAINSVHDIATGAITSAAKRIENSLADAIPVAIGFLAQFVGLGKISKKVKEFILKVQAKVDAAIDKAIAKVVAFVKKMIGKLTGKDKKARDETDDPEKAAKVKSGLAQLHAEGKKFAAKKSVSKGDAEQVASTVKSRNPIFKTIIVVAGKESWDYVYEASPSEKEEGDIPRETVKVALADLDASEHAKKGSWDVNLTASVGGEKPIWGFVHVLLLPDMDLPPPRPQHSMYLDNRVTVGGKPVKLKLIDGSFTDYALRKSIALYETRYGAELKELHGDLRSSNLANFQQEFGQRTKKLSQEAAAQGAIRAISFGSKRVELGYKSFEITMSGFTKIDKMYVPTRVLVIAKKG
jgi:hypothetical protein